MKVNKIRYNPSFKQSFKKLSKEVQLKACKAEKIFRENPFYPGLRLHKLKGKLNDLWSISLDRKNRIIFRVMDDGVILFVSIGSHAIYEE